MRLPKRTLAAALVVAAIPLYAGNAAAAPLSQSLALNSTDVGMVEQVQNRRSNRDRWIAPAAGVAAGVAIGGALAPRDGYYAYGAAPGYVEPGSAYRPTPGYPAAGSSGRCTADSEHNAAFPSWMC